MRKVAWRLIPFLIVCYFISYLDRVNVGFADGSVRFIKQSINLLTWQALSSRSNGEVVSADAF